MKTKIDGGFIVSEKVGNGIPLLFIHGYPLSRKIWEPQVKVLAIEATIITLDLRGHGESSEFNEPYGMDQLAEDCIKVLQSHQVDEPVVVCGHSMGGYISLALYRHYPSTFRGWIFNSTRPGQDSAEGKANRDASMKIALEQGSKPIADGMIQKMFAPSTDQTNPGLVSDVRKIMEKTSPRGIAGALKAMRDRPDSTPMLPSIKCPVLIIHGEEDQLIPIKEADMMHQLIPGSTLNKIPKAGHLPSLEQPNLFTQAIHKYIKQIS